MRLKESINGSAKRGVSQIQSRVVDDVDAQDPRATAGKEHLFPSSRAGKERQGTRPHMKHGGRPGVLREHKGIWRKNREVRIELHQNFHQ